MATRTKASTVVAPVLDVGTGAGTATGASPPAAGTEGPGSASGTAVAPSTTGGIVLGGGTPTPKKKTTRGKNPTNALRKPKVNQVAMSPGVAAEIRASVANGTYVPTFGPHAPDGVSFATWLEQASAASTAATHAEQQVVAANDTRNQTWNTTFVKLVDPFQSVFDVALASDPTVADNFPLTTAFLATDSAIGKRSATTRAAKKATAGKATT